MSEDELQSQPQTTALKLLQQGLQALAANDWDALRSLCHEDIVWRIPGRSPLAGELSGPDAVVARFRLMTRATAHDKPAELVALLGGADFAAVVQRNHIDGHEGRTQPFTAVTLVRAQDGQIAELQYFVSDQYATDALWSERL